MPIDRTGDGSGAMLEIEQEDARGDLLVEICNRHQEVLASGHMPIADVWQVHSHAYRWLATRLPWLRN